jgi:hypothetical protein
MDGIGSSTRVSRGLPPQVRGVTSDDDGPFFPSRWTGQDRSYFDLTFWSESITIYSCQSPVSGQYAVILDDRQVALSSAYSPVFRSNVSIFEKTGLEPGKEHRVRLINGNGTLFFDWAELKNR